MRERIAMTAEAGMSSWSVVWALDQVVGQAEQVVCGFARMDDLEHQRWRPRA